MIWCFHLHEMKLTACGILELNLAKPYKFNYTCGIEKTKTVLMKQRKYWLKFEGSSAHYKNNNGMCTAY